MGKRRLLMLAVVMSLVAVPLMASATHVAGVPVTKETVVPELGAGWSCPDGQKIEDPFSGNPYSFTFGEFDGYITIVVNGDKSITFTTSEVSFVVDTVLVKGGKNALVYYYDPGEHTHTVFAPINPKNGKPYGVSHLCFLTDKKP